MSISADVFSHLEQMIRWGAVDAIRQHEFLSILMGQPNLACDCDEYGISLLMVAADAGNRAVMEALCSLDANVDAISDGGETALVNAIRWKSAEDFDGRMRHQMVQLLLERGADPNLIGFQGCSALHWAVIEGDPSIVEILLDHKGNVDLCISDRDPMTAMDILLSDRFRGTIAQREAIAELLNSKKGVSIR